MDAPYIIENADCPRVGNTWQSVGFKRVLSLSVIFSNTIEGC